MKISIVLSSFIACLSLTGIVAASNYTFLNDSAITRFTSKDNQLMQANIFNALDHTADGKKSSWKNPASGAWGYAMPYKTTKAEGTVCRHLTIYNEAAHIPGKQTYTFCKLKGKWKIV